MNILPDPKSTDQRFKVNQSLAGPTVGQTIPHDSAVGHVSGCLLYTSDAADE